jgi:hypothetical protein
MIRQINVQTGIETQRPLNSEEQERVDAGKLNELLLAKTQYQRDRKTEYPTIEECVHAILDDEIDALQIKRQAVKQKYPKENS